MCKRFQNNKIGFKIWKDKKYFVLNYSQLKLSFSNIFFLTETLCKRLIWNKQLKVSQKIPKILWKRELGKFGQNEWTEDSTLADG